MSVAGRHGNNWYNSVLPQPIRRVVPLKHMTEVVQSWADAIGPEKEKPYFISLRERVHQARENGNTIYPSEHDTFNAFRLTPLEQVKVVILGQDPYHGPDQAHGLAFSVKPTVRIPPSLLNIYKELRTDIPGFTMPNHGYLENWAQQGVLLLNTVLTVQAGMAHSHAAWGWETFTDQVIRTLNDKREHLVFMLWGNHAKKKGEFIDKQRHLVLTGVHPSPLSASRGFFGCRHFSKANDYLQTHGQAPIDWQV
jgi:uracil-DNA glycosylase